MEKRYREDDMEIDLLELLFEFKKRAWIIILAAVLGCLGAGAYSRLILTPVYTQVLQPMQACELATIKLVISPPGP